MDTNMFVDWFHRLALFIVTPECYQVFFYDLDFFNGEYSFYLLTYFVIIFLWLSLKDYEYSLCNQFNTSFHIDLFELCTVFTHVAF